MGKPASAVSPRPVRPAAPEAAVSTTAGAAAASTITSPQQDPSTLAGETVGEAAREVVLAALGALPLRESFLQLRGSPPEPGPFSELVRGRHHHALDLYLLVVAATAQPPHQLHVHPDFWAVILRRPNQSLRNSRLAVYRSFDIL